MTAISTLGPRTARALGLATAALLAACRGGGDTGEETGSIDAPPAAGWSEPHLNDANIFALLDHANQADSAAAAVATAKGTDGQVRRYARMLMADHHRLRREDAALAKRLGVTPLPPADDPITAISQQATEALEAAEKGRDFDRTYLAHEINAHRAVLELTEQSLRSAGNAELRATLERARPLFRAHLEQARQILERLEAAA